jgi:hypothetical protein
MMATMVVIQKAVLVDWLELRPYPMRIVNVLPRQVPKLDGKKGW